MTRPVFRDDSSPADKRAAASKRLLALCPTPYRGIMQPFVELAFSRASDDEIAALLGDIDYVRILAEKGDVSGIADLARKYGATDEQVQTYLPAFLTPGKVD